MTQDDSRMSQGMRGNGRGGLFLGRFYSSKWLDFLSLDTKKVLVYFFSHRETVNSYNKLTNYFTQLDSESLLEIHYSLRFISHSRSFLYKIGFLIQNKSFKRSSKNRFSQVLITSVSSSDQFYL